jgi:hypothetical protein
MYVMINRTENIRRMKGVTEYHLDKGEKNHLKGQAPDEEFLC